ncbi:MAG TPA: ribose-phosphate pyrophosphokinase [Aliidongia sp.]|nr:ribose-phosphate pyrophosphokinase [Aliidongia sp.]
MKVLIGTANPALGREVTAALGLSPIEATLRRFADLEQHVEIHENVRGEDVYIIQPTSTPSNDTLMELLIAADTLKRGSARRITAVLPYFGYARQDRKSGPRTPISAKLVANMMVAAGIDRLLTLDLHAGQIQGFFDIPVDHLEAAPLFAADVQRRWGRNIDGVTIVSPDIGGVVRARRLLGRLANGRMHDLAIIDKRRPAAGVSEVMNIIGDVEGRHCVMVDDIADSAGTLCNAAAALLDAGALSVSAYVTHAVLSPGAVERIAKSRLDAFIATDSIAATEEAAACAKIQRLSVAGLIADAIREIDSDGSISRLNLR